MWVRILKDIVHINTSHSLWLIYFCCSDNSSDSKFHKKPKGKKMARMALWNLYQLFPMRFLSTPYGMPPWAPFLLSSPLTLNQDTIFFYFLNSLFDSYHSICKIDHQFLKCFFLIVNSKIFKLIHSTLK